MADKSVGELIAATSVTPTDLFVLEQNGTAKKLTGQILENWLVSFADGHGGIQNIEKIGMDVLADTYRITLSDTTTFDFVVTNGRGISSIAKTSTSGLIDTYTITYNDGTKDTLTVTNGEKGEKGDNAYIWVKYASQEPTASSNSFGDLPDDWMGVYFGTASTAPSDWQQYKWYLIKGEKGETGDPATLTSAEITYQVGDSGTIIPSGNWSNSVPPVTSGRYLWTRQVLQFNTGAPITSYSVSRFGIDGTGAVSSVAGIAPDENGNVPLDAASVKALPIGGGIMEGSIDMNGQSLFGLNAPTKDDEPATKGYADNLKPDLTGYATETYVEDAITNRTVNNFTTTGEGFLADARALKTLNDSKMSMELLWENASPTSGFGGQSVKGDFSQYTHVMIFAIRSTTNDANMTAVLLKVGDAGHIQGNIDGFIHERAVVVLPEEVLFYNHSFYRTYGGTSESNDAYIIPTAIYGIKGVSV